MFRDFALESAEISPWNIGSVDASYPRVEHSLLGAGGDPLIGCVNYTDKHRKRNRQTVIHTARTTGTCGFAKSGTFLYI
jgi:hypothetical protein